MLEIHLSLLECTLHDRSLLAATWTTIRLDCVAQIMKIFVEINDDLSNML
jgi:hypothetical protein